MPADLPPLGWATVLSQWQLAPLPTVLAVWLAGLYLAGVLALRGRGDHWSARRIAAFLGGVLGFYLVTSSGLAAYDTVLLSVHMVQHMVLTMLVPLLLALGAPVTLALRTLPLRPRGWLLGLLHSPVVRVLSFPPLTFALFVLSPWALYFSGWYAASLRSAYVHEMTHVHLMLTGCLFLWPLVGADPVPGRVSYPLRMLLLVLTLPFHAFLGVTIMGQRPLLAQQWYAGLTLPWLPDPADDQRLAGGILWGTGDVVGLLFCAALFAQWVASSVRESAREDRRLDRLDAVASARDRSLPPAGPPAEGPGLQRRRHGP